MTTTCYPSCPAPSSIVGHAPTVVHALAFTGSGAGLNDLTIVGIVVGCAGLAFLADHMIRRSK